MQKASTDYDWDQALANSLPDQQINHYDDTIINIAKNFIPNEFKKFNAISLGYLLLYKISLVRFNTIYSL